MMRGCCAVLLVAIGTAAWADRPASIAVFPPRVQLDSARDRQRLVVQAVRADGCTEDVTAAATVTARDEDRVAIDRAGGGILVAPRADGETSLRVEHAGLAADVPLRVVSATATPPLSFRLDVMPVFARAGCNMGSCHGAARGRDGFRLSLFGFDPAGDHQRITREFPGRRIDPGVPDRSLLVQKAIGAVPHTGGKRFAADSDLARRLVDWIAAGAPADPGPVPALVGLDLHPPTAVLPGGGARQSVVALARFADGSDRDVTDLCWYGSTNDAVAKVDPEGRITSGGRGESFIMARYDTITVGRPVVVVPVEGGFTFPPQPAATWIDELVNAKLATLRIAPSAVCDDETFLRRVSLDLVGLLPSAEERAAFLADTGPDKRGRLVDGLLARREFVDLWVLKWAEVLQIRSQGNEVGPKAAALYHRWLERKIAANEPVDRMVHDLLTAAGSTFENPAANYFQLERDPLKLSENVAQAFLGMRIQCAQCHNHPFDRWTMDDYYGFAAFFSQVARKRGADPRETIVHDSGSGDMRHPVGGAVVPPKFLGGPVPDLAGRDRRAAVAAWLTAADNPYFSRHVANLTWAHFFGRGIVHEPDDVRVSNPPVNGPLFDALGRRLAESGWDFRALVRDIVTSQTYQRSCEVNESNKGDDANFSHAAVRRMRAEVLLDALAQVTGTKHKFPGLPLGGRAVQVADGRTTTYFLTTFGRATRENVCTCAVRMDPNLSQALHLLNGDVANERIRQGGLVAGWIKAGKPDAEIVDELFVRCFGRMPSDAERTETVAVVAAAADRGQALEDVFWALLNSPEFLFNH